MNYITRDRKSKPQPYKHIASMIRFRDNRVMKGGKLYLVTCDRCGGKASIQPSGSINRARQKEYGLFCSSECRKNPSNHLPCPICHKETKTSVQKYCSKVCYAQWQLSSENRGKNHPHYTGSYKGRNCKSSIYRSWRTNVFERDLYTCQACFQIGGQLNAHHIKPYKNFPELELELSNGLTLCVKCHREHHKSHEASYMHY